MELMSKEAKFRSNNAVPPTRTKWQKEHFEAIESRVGRGTALGFSAKVRNASAVHCKSRPVYCCQPLSLALSYAIA